MGNRAGHRRRFTAAIGDVQLGSDELMRQDQARIPPRSRRQYSQQLRLGVSLATQRKAVHPPRVRIVFPIALCLRARRGRHGNIVKEIKRMRTAPVEFQRRQGAGGLQMKRKRTKARLYVELRKEASPNGDAVPENVESIVEGGGLGYLY